MLRRIVVAVLFALAACSTPAEKITARLEAAGVPHHQARCMGDRLAQRLSYDQLDQLNHVVKDSGGEKLSVNRLIKRLGDTNPELVSQLVRTGIGCAL